MGDKATRSHEDIIGGKEQQLKRTKKPAQRLQIRNRRAGVLLSFLEQSKVQLWICRIYYEMITPLEGDNDGLVSVESAKWGESFTLLTGRTNRGVSHYDEIDFRRAPLSSKCSGEGVTDICDVYKAIVTDLVEQGF